MSRKIISQSIIGIFLVGLLGFGIMAGRAYKQPMASPLSVNVQQVTPTVGAPADSNCGLSGSLIIMLLGRDDRVWVYPPGSDTIRYIKVDFSEKKVKAFTFFRDLLLATPSLKATYIFDQNRLGRVYQDVLDKEKGKLDADYLATNADAQTIYDNFALVADHYVTFKESMPWQIIDILGGIEVVLPADFHFESDFTLDLKAGKQIFYGDTAQKYMRALHTAVMEWDRTDRQNIVLQGILKKIKDPTVVAKIPELYKLFLEGMVTDLTPEQILSMACLASQLDWDKDITLDEMAKEEVIIQADDSILIKDLPFMQKKVTDFFK
jgi:LCP family protein required for cell wall assembly